jgi:hypothetical protein
MTRQSPPDGTPNRPTKRNHCLVHDEGLPLQTCTCSPGAASRSEQSAAIRACETCFTLGRPCAEHAAAEAAQSPQEGAADVDAIRAQAFEEAAALCDSKAVDYRDAGNVDADQAAGLCARRIRDWSERSRAQPAAGPPVNPPVASADPELATLLRAARVAINELHGMYAYADLLTGIDSALSRLAGQAPKNPNETHD